MPSDGDVYLFDIDVIGKDWRCDDYLWRQNGTCKFPNRNPVAKMTYYKMSLKNHYEKRHVLIYFPKLRRFPLTNQI